jgi:ATPase subunit of ABC transporter with duplicated ATPase domains
MLTVKNIRKHRGGELVLRNVSFSLGEGQKVALVGENGVGKSTLLEILAGVEPLERGEIRRPNRVFTGYLPQELLAEGDETLFAYLRRSAGIKALEDEMARLEARLEEAKIQARYDELLHEYTRLGGHEFPKRARRMLEGLALGRLSPDQKVDTLSGGERRKAALAGALLRGADLLLLDEPTNNLDRPALAFLETFLQESQATLLVASHDRSFLDAVVTKVLEIDRVKRDAVLYTGNWSTYDETRRKAVRRHRETYQRQEEEKKRLLGSGAEKRDWSERVWEEKNRDTDKMTAHYKKERAAKKFSTSAKVLEKRGARLNQVEAPLMRPPLELSFGEESLLGETVLSGEALVCGYPEGFRTAPLDFSFRGGERVALLGDNGAGKSTFLKTLSGELAPLSGEFFRHEGLRFGSLVQEHERLAEAERAPLREVFLKRLGTVPGFDEERLPFLFHEVHLPLDLLDSPLRYASPGERVRVLLLFLSLERVNFLLLDEPTNHLDLDTIEALEEALAAYPGNLLLVSHDRRFLEALEIDRTLTLEKGKLLENGI